MQEYIQQAYRDWFAQEPCHTQIETMESHVARFVAWFLKQKQPIVEAMNLKAA